MTAPRLIVWNEEPLLVETPSELLPESPITPNERFFVRNHGVVPALDPTGELVVTGLVRRPLRLRVADLQRSFERTSVEATLACAGNRRADLAAVRPVPGEVPWGAGAIGNAVWTGVRLADVLADAGVRKSAAHVAFAGRDASPEAAEFGASIPLAKALQPEVLLAWEMNGVPLPPEHGHPLRVVVPGYVGARSVKWLARVDVRARPSSNYFQARGYRLLPAAGSGAGEPLGELPVNSALCRARVTGRVAALAGYAHAGGERTVERVELSLDGGETWTRAAFTSGAVSGAWRLWRARLELRRGPNAVLVRAFDSAGSGQPEDARLVWNRKGYAGNAVQRTELVAIY